MSMLASRAGSSGGRVKLCKPRLRDGLPALDGLRALDGLAALEGLLALDGLDLFDAAADRDAFGTSTRPGAFWRSRLDIPEIRMKSLGSAQWVFADAVGLTILQLCPSQSQDMTFLDLSI